MRKRNRVILLFLVLLTPGGLTFGQTAQPAGEVTAQIPEGLITRPKEIRAADVGAEVLWNDLLVTRPNGRMRVTLRDTSVLNVGPGSSFRVVRHDERTRETEVTLTYGKMRARVAKESDRQKFEVKTNTAVIGVIGTDFFTESSLVRTAVMVYEGEVRVRSLDPAIPGETVVRAGEMVEIGLGQPPGPARPASAAELNNSLQETEVGPPLPAPTLPTVASQPPVQQPPPPPPPPSSTPAPPAGGGEPAKFNMPPFAADQVVSQPGGAQYRSRMYMGQNGYRMETNQMGQQSIAIQRYDLQVIWVLMPADKTYMETPVQQQASMMDMARDPETKVERQLVGPEPVGEYRCLKYRMRITHRGNTWTGSLWVAPELKDFPVKWADDATNTVVEFQNIRLGEPDRSLFEVPPGYRKMTY